MADGFRPEVLAAFMQQVVDEPVIPNLFLRTVHSSRSLLLAAPMSDASSSGHPSCHDLQVAAALRLDDAPLAPHRQKGLDRRPALGGLHPPRQGHRAQLVCGAPPASEGAARRACAEAADDACAAARIRGQECVLLSLLRPKFPADAPRFRRGWSAERTQSGGPRGSRRRASRGAVAVRKRNSGLVERACVVSLPVAQPTIRDSRDPGRRCDFHSLRSPRSFVGHQRLRTNRLAIS